MSFSVPQFIEIEDKIFGPFTFKQFIYLLGGAAIPFVLWKILPLPGFIKIILVAPFVVLALALAFRSVNNRPFSAFLESAFKYTFSDKLYVWKPPKKKKKGKEAMSEEKKKSLIPKLSSSKLHDLAWSLDVNENYGG
jgi:hypothetical protein